MRRVDNLIRELQKFPPDALCHGYEGEDTGLTVCLPNNGRCGFIACRETDDLDEEPAEMPQ